MSARRRGAKASESSTGETGETSPVRDAASPLSAIWAALRLDRVAIAYSATRKSTRVWALLLVLGAGVAQPAQLRLLDDAREWNSSADLTRPTIWSQAIAAVAHAGMALLFSAVAAAVFRQFDKAVATREVFCVLGLASVWSLVAWPVALWDRSLPIGPLSNLLVLVTLVLGMSELGGVRVVGALLLVLTSGVASACCALLALTTFAAVAFGVLVGVAGSAFGATDLQQFFEQQFGIHVDVADI